MIRGRFFAGGRTMRPFIDGVFEFAGPTRRLEVPLLVDTGADRTILAPWPTMTLSKILEEIREVLG